MRDEAKSLFGQLDTGLMCYQRATDIVEEKWKSQEARMRIEDIKRAKLYCKNALKYIKRIQVTLKQFENIAEKSEEVCPKN